MKQCPKCNIQFEDDKSFCPFDGTKLKKVVTNMEKTMGEEAKESAKTIATSLGKLTVLGLKAGAKGIKRLAEKTEKKE